MPQEHILVNDIISDHRERMLNLKKYYPFFKLSEVSFSWYKEGLYDCLDMGYILMAVLRFFIEENNFKEFMILCKTSALQGNSHAQYILGIFYEEGILGLERYFENKIEADEKYHNMIDYKKALKWYKKSADLGYIYAIGHLGLCYLYGKGVKKNADKASKLLEQARENGVHWDHYTWERKSSYKD